MSERGDGSALGSGREPASVMVVQPGLAPGASLGLALSSSAGLASIAPVSGQLGPAAVVAVVLVEAIALYASYGALTRVVGPALHRLVASD